MYKSTLALLVEFQQRRPRLAGQSHSSQNQWQPPPPNAVKVNFDGDVFGDSHGVGVGFVIRNDHGEMMALLSEKIVMPSSMEVLEMLATTRADIFA